MVAYNSAGDNRTMISTICRCPNCDMALSTTRPVAIACPRCKTTIECLGGKQHQPASAITTLPRDQWPFWAIQIANHAADGETGVGDTAKRLIEASHLDTLAVIANWLGVPCGCSARHARWNKLYPYQSQPASASQQPAACTMCGKPATTMCNHTLSLGMCGHPLCDDCKHPHVI